jgi:F0F1-type ATP synthase membrane subunit c/vacuolar-type H+-ATPase subunit K
MADRDASDLYLQVLERWKYGLDCLPQRIDAFGAALSSGLAGACTASGNRLFAAFAKAALERIPAATNSDRAVADHD